MKILCRILILTSVVVEGEGEEKREESVVENEGVCKRNKH